MTTTMRQKAETLPRPARELEELATYYDTHDTSAEMEHGRLVDPRPMQTTSLRLPIETVEALKNRAQEKGVRYTALLREIIEKSIHGFDLIDHEELEQINQRLARIEAAIAKRTSAKTA